MRRYISLLVADVVLLCFFIWLGWQVMELKNPWAAVVALLLALVGGRLETLCPKESCDAPHN